MSRRNQSAQRAWDLLAFALFVAALVVNLALFVTPFDAIDLGIQIVITILLAFPAVLALQRKMLISEFERLLAARLPVTIHASNHSIWNAYKRLIDETPDRGHVRVMNLYNNIDNGRVVTSADDDEFYKRLARRSRLAKETGGHLTLRSITSSRLAGHMDHINRREKAFAEEGVDGDIQSAALDIFFPIDILISEPDAVVIDIPEVYGHPVQGIGFEIRDKRVRDAFAGWYDANFWPEQNTSKGHWRLVPSVPETGAPTAPDNQADPAIRPENGS